MTLPTHDVRWAGAAPPSARGFFTTRGGGVSTGSFASLNLGGHVGDDPAAVTDNRRRLAAHAGVTVDALATMRQVHGADVAVVHSARQEPEPPVDAMVTSRRGLVLTVLVADCVPVLLADAGGGVVGVAHAGRAGMVAGVVGETVAAMRRLGARDVRAAVGPAVCGACYALPQDLADVVAGAVPDARAVARDGAPAADVRAGVVSQLAAAGVTEVTVSDVCTRESPDHFSYRRDGRRTGRLAGCVWLPA